MKTTVGEIGLPGSPAGALLDLAHLHGTYREVGGAEGQGCGLVRLGELVISSGSAW